MKDWRAEQVEAYKRIDEEFQAPRRRRKVKMKWWRNNVPPDEAKKALNQLLGKDSPR